MVENLTTVDERKIKRILKVKKLSGLNDSQFAAKLGMVKQTFFNIKKMRQDIHDKYLVRIVQNFEDVDAQWLLTGKSSVADQEKELAAKAAQLEKEFEIQSKVYRKSYEEVLKGKDAQLAQKDATIADKETIIASLRQVISLQEQLLKSKDG